jgi:hypothetical protein
MSKEKSLLFVRISIHCDQSTSRCKYYYVLSFSSWPLDIMAFVRLISNNVLQFHYWVFVKFLRSLYFNSTILSTSIFSRSTGSSRLRSLYHWWVSLLKFFLHDESIYWMVRFTSAELHLKLSLCVIIFHLSILLSLADIIIIFSPPFFENIVNFLSHYFSLFFSW